MDGPVACWFYTCTTERNCTTYIHLKLSFTEHTYIPAVDTGPLDMVIIRFAEEHSIEVSEIGIITMEWLPVFNPVVLTMYGEVPAVGADIQYFNICFLNLNGV